MCGNEMSRHAEAVMLCVHASAGGVGGLLGRAKAGVDLAGKVIVCVITGNCLKDPERAMAEFAPELRAVEPELSRVEEEMGL